MTTVERRLVPPEPVEPKVEYVITLTEPEARALRSYLGDSNVRIFDHPTAFRVWKDLAEAGANYDPDKTHR